MERVSRYLETTDEATLRTIRTAVAGHAEYVDLASKCLVDEGFVTTSSGPRGASLHRSVRAYRE
jgi:hypothetical protein